MDSTNALILKIKLFECRKYDLYNALIGFYTKVEPQVVL